MMAELKTKEDYTKRYGRMVVWSDEDNVFVARAIELKGCSTHGDTFESAMKNLDDAILSYLDALEEKNLPFPEPASVAKQKKAFPLRLDPQLYNNLQMMANLTGRSINDIIQSKLGDTTVIKVKDLKGALPIAEGTYELHTKKSEPLPKKAATKYLKKRAINAPASAKRK